MAHIELRDLEEPPRPVRRARRAALSSADILHLTEAYRSGVPTTQLAKMYGAGKGTVLRVLHEAGVPMRRQPMTADERTEVIRLYGDGWSLARIGTTFGRQHTVIRDVLTRAGIVRRDSHGRRVELN